MLMYLQIDRLETSINDISQRQSNLEQEFNNEKSREKLVELSNLSIPPFFFPFFSPFFSLCFIESWY